MNDLDPRQLIRLLTEQRDSYRALRALGDRQRTLISGDRPELLLNILQDRQKLVAALAAINQRLAPFRRDWDACHAGLPPDLRATAGALLAEVDDLLTVILEADEQDGRMLKARQQAVSQSLSRMSGNRAAHAAYTRQATSNQEDRR